MLKNITQGQIVTKNFPQLLFKGDKFNNLNSGQLRFQTTTHQALVLKTPSQQPPFLPNSKFTNLMSDSRLGTGGALVRSKLALPNGLAGHTRTHGANLRRKQAHITKPIIGIKNATRKQKLKPIPFFLNRYSVRGLKVSHKILDLTIIIPIDHNGFFPGGMVDTLGTHQLRGAKQRAKFNLMPNIVENQRNRDMITQGHIKKLRMIARQGTIGKSPIHTSTTFPTCGLIRGHGHPPKSRQRDLHFARTNNFIEVTKHQPRLRKRDGGRKPLQQTGSKFKHRLLLIARRSISSSQKPPI